MGVRVLVVVASIVLPTAARAEPRFELSGFLGVDWFAARTELGNSSLPEQVPGSAPVFGARFGWLARPALPGGLSLAIEGELGMSPAFTGSNPRSGRTSFFAPVFAWRGHAVLRLTRWRILAPHLVLGVGGDTVASSSPFLATDTDPVAYWGAGLSTPVSGNWQLRLDARHGIMPARGGGVVSTAELAFSIGTTFGPSERPASPARPPAQPAAASRVDGDGDGDRDGDGVPDRRDACPDQPETWNGVADDDGCPEPDPDGDGIVGDADHCPDQAEDRDGWQDDDGCPDPDNDGDGIADASDACPGEAETVNGWQDDDGCPDELPPDVVAALATPVRFEPGHARVTEPVRAALGEMRAMLEHRAELRLAIIGHPERPGADDLARRRAEAVKWSLIDQGIAEDRIVTRVGPVPGAPAITFQLAPPR